MLIKYWLNKWINLNCVILSPTSICLSHYLKFNMLCMHCLLKNFVEQNIGLSKEVNCLSLGLFTRSYSAGWSAFKCKVQNWIFVDGKLSKSTLYECQPYCCLPSYGTAPWITYLKWVCFKCKMENKQEIAERWIW